VLKILISLVIGLVIGGGITFSLMSEKNNNPNTTEVYAVCPTTNAEDKNINNNLQQENIALLAALKNAKAELNKASASSSANPNTAKVTPDCTADVNSAISAFNEKDKIVNELKNAKSLHDYDTNLYNQFISEEPNEIWAKSVEDKFFNLLNKNHETQAIVISSLDCRAKTCKIKTPVTDQSAKNRVMEVMSEPSFLKALGFNKATTRPAMENTGGEMTFYISNNQ
jgi:hypothetical protein